MIQQAILHELRNGALPFAVVRRLILQNNPTMSRMLVFETLTDMLDNNRVEFTLFGLLRAT